MDLYSLDKAHKGASKHNKRSEDMVFFEVDKYARLRVLRNQINDRSYIPLQNYSFIHRRGQAPREVYAAEPELKIMMTYGLARMTPIIETHLSPRTFNNRVGMGAHAAINTVLDDINEVSEDFTKPYILVKWDYRGYFPYMLRDYAWKLVYRIIKSEYHGWDKGDVTYCLYVACFSEPSRSQRRSPIWEWNDYPEYKSVYRRAPGVGGFIGYTFWQMVASLYPAEIDEFVAINITIHFVRYVDDTIAVIALENKEDALVMISELRRRAAAIGITLHPRKFYCQPGEHGVEFLGYRLLPGRIHLKQRTVNRAFTVARSKERGNRNYIHAVNSYLGMIKASTDRKTAVALLDAVERRGIVKDYEKLKITIA